LVSSNDRNFSGPASKRGDGMVLSEVLYKLSRVQFSTEKREKVAELVSDYIAAEASRVVERILGVKASPAEPLDATAPTAIEPKVPGSPVVISGSKRKITGR
jgi:hypothetical protein